MRKRNHLTRSAGRIGGKQPKRAVDIWLFILPLLFTLFGILMIYEASNVSAFKDFSDKYRYVKDQLAWFGVGVFAFFVTSKTPYRAYYSLAVPLLLCTLLSLFVVFIPGIGTTVLGARRWISIGSFSFQPSELAKLSLTLYLSSWLSTKERGRFLPFFLLLSLVVGLVVLQPDLGTAVILTLLFLVLYFLSGAPLTHVLSLIPVLLSFGAGAALIAPYRAKRLVTFFNPASDPLGSSYHIRQILISLGSGGLLGMGIGASRQKYQFLPEATTDSIFAIMGEELGFVGTVFYILVFFVFLYRIFLTVGSSRDKQAFLLSSGILSLFTFQTVINLGAMVALIPLTGVPLPFISYGGSNLVISYAALGILVNINKHGRE